MAVAGAPWQLECEKMEQRCGYLLTSGQWSDCTFMVGSDTNQTAAAVPAHKLVLAMASPVFEAMFYGGLSEGNDPIVQIPDIQPEAFRALLQYIYTGHADIASFDMAWDLWYGANKYMLPHLINECNTYICSVLGPKNACRAYEFACLFDEKTIMDKCIKIISTNTKEVLNDSSFVDVQLNTVITVFSLNQLNVDSELDLFHALARYAEAEQKRQLQITPLEDVGLPSEELSDQLLSLSGVRSSQTSPIAEPGSKPSTKVVTSEPIASIEKLKEEVNRVHTIKRQHGDHSYCQAEVVAKRFKNESDEPTVRGALQKIRFLSLTAQQFAEGPALSKLLTKDDSYAVLMNMASTATPVPMPTGFSECRAPHSVSMDQCITTGCLEHIIKALKFRIHLQVEEGVIPKLNLGYGGDVAENAARVLGDIVYDKPHIRDSALKLGALPAMLPYMHPNTPLTRLRTYVRAYSNMCEETNSKVSFELLSPALPYITELLAVTDEEVLSQACLALVGLTYGPNECEERVQATPGLMERLIALLGHPASHLQIEALRTIANMLSGTDVQVDQCLDAGCLDHIINFLKCDEPILLKEQAALAVCNIFEKTDLQIQKALDKQILEPLIKVLSEGDVKCQNHAAWAISSMCFGGTAEQLNVLVSAGFLEPYCLLLSSPDHPDMLHMLEGLSILLQKVGQTTRLAVCVKLREIGVPQVLTTLQQHEHEQIRLTASSLMQTYFPDAVPADNATRD